MSEAETILKLIETVDPNDDAKLNEIDGRVWCYLSNMRYGGISIEGRVVFTDDESSFRKLSSTNEKYTRSRDALKRIRPDEWGFSIGRSWKESGHGHVYYCIASNINSKYAHGKERYSKKHLTEELCELHAIIQAIDLDRAN